MIPMQMSMVVMEKHRMMTMMIGMLISAASVVRGDDEAAGSITMSNTHVHFHMLSSHTQETFAFTSNITW